VKLTVYVVDQTNARISGASLIATDMATGASLRATSSATGQAIVNLSPGTYNVTARAKGFDSLEQQAMQLDADREWTFTLRIGSSGGPTFVNSTYGPEPEYQAISADINAEPLEQLAPPPAKPIHRKRHLF
jgi:hypothetical protein